LFVNNKHKHVNLTDALLDSSSNAH
jgi:hypothetical protein